MRTDSTGAARVFAAALKLLADHPDALQEAALRGALAFMPHHPGGEAGRQQDRVARDAGLRSGDPEVVAIGHPVPGAVGRWE